MAKVTRGDVSSIVLPDEVSEVLLRGAAESSVIAQLANTRPMAANRVELTEAELGDANVFWVGEGMRKSTDAPAMPQLTWRLDAAELAVIIPIDENVFEDATVDLFDLYRPSIETAIARKLDIATLFGGGDFPNDWDVPTGPADGSIRELTLTAGHVFAEDADPTDDELLTLIAGSGQVSGTPDGALQAIEEDGYEPSEFLAAVRFRARLRHLKDADGRFIFGDAVSAGVPATLFGLPIDFVATKGNRWDSTEAHMIAGDFSQAILGTRQGIRYKVFDQGVITDGAGNVVYSLMENDMVALRVTARYGFKVIADDTALGATLDATSEFPFAIVGPFGSDA